MNYISFWHNSIYSDILNHFIRNWGNNQSLDFSQPQGMLHNLYKKLSQKWHHDKHTHTHTHTHRDYQGSALFLFF
jgi:hypothetical protein